MKYFSLFWAAALLGLSLPARGQNVSAADLALERRANEERFKRIEASIQSLQETQILLLDRATRLENKLTSAMRDLDRLKEEGRRPTVQWATREDLRSLAETVQEIDRKREADKKLILEGFKELAKLPVPSAPSPSTAPPAKITDDYVMYEVKQSGETTSAIIAMYNEDFKSKGQGTISLDQVKRLNPEVNLDLIYIGTKLKIPLPQKR